MKIMRQVVVFDAADLAAESSFWAGMLGGRVFTDDTFHSVIDADGRWAIGVQLAPDHIPPDWPDGSPQQVHLDLHIDDPAAPAPTSSPPLGARLLQATNRPDRPPGAPRPSRPALPPLSPGAGPPGGSSLRPFPLGTWGGVARGGKGKGVGGGGGGGTPRPCPPGPPPRPPPGGGRAGQVGGGGDVDLRYQSWAASSSVASGSRVATSSSSSSGSRLS